VQNYEKYVLEIGPGKDSHPQDIAVCHPNWLVVCLDSNDDLLGFYETRRTLFEKYKRNNLPIENLVFAKQNILEPISGLEINLYKGKLEIPKNLFNTIHVHYVFTSSEFEEGYLDEKLIFPIAFKQAVLNLLEVLQPNGILYISGEYGLSSKKEEYLIVKQILTELIDENYIHKLRKKDITDTQFSEASQFQLKKITRFFKIRKK